MNSINKLPDSLLAAPELGITLSGLGGWGALLFQRHPCLQGTPEAASLGPGPWTVPLFISSTTTTALGFLNALSRASSVGAESTRYDTRNRLTGHCMIHAGEQVVPRH